MWRLANSPHDYHLFFDEGWQRDIESMALRDKNHPSIILWSIGNQIKDRRILSYCCCKMLGDHIRIMEPSRPVTRKY
jgi:beta-galactosidase